MDIAEFIEAWHKCVVERDLEGITAMLADETRLSSPAFFKPITAKAPIAFMLTQIVQLLPDFRYVATFTNDEGGIVLQFVGTLSTGEREYQVEGVDILTLDERGKVTDFVVMIRPLSSLQALATEMKKFFAGG